ncbi:Transcription factor AP-2 [Strongyloides ratti]|uniref:Transcription factor AP-2 n=1 Tax=Strongyloides ratti TaxID=34506 RepID=A0A090LN35_STRRB|nr:Transcription factor AP-2 [Strongyloides ratti]CEF71240.1 Transcription factor AP-2 [Strongyloides ratti]
MSSFVDTSNTVSNFLPEDLALLISSFNQSNHLSLINSQPMNMLSMFPTVSNSYLFDNNTNLINFPLTTTSNDQYDLLSKNKTNLPKESDKGNRKRNYIIEELLEIKKSKKDNDKEVDGKKVQSSFLERIQFNGDEDTETTSSLTSISSQSSNNISPNIINSNDTLNQECIANALAIGETFESNANLLVLSNTIPLNILQMGKTSGKDQGVTEFPLMNVPKDKIFAQVPGRLSLLSNVVKYKMTVSEIRRRLLGPESFNFSLLGALLRRAKMPAKSQALVNELGEIGLFISRGRRRISNVTLMSALTEAEALVLAKDFNSVSKQYFPVHPLAIDANKKFLEKCSSKEVAKKCKIERITKMKNAIEVFEELSQYMENDRSPILDQEDTPILSEQIQDQLSHYSMLTHGFGVKSLLVGVQIGIKYINAVLSDLNEPILTCNIDMFER